MKFGRRTPPLVSVVVPVFNVAAYLPHCLESLLAQRRVELDIVVVDDGSTDESGAIADRYAAEESRVRVVHTDNHGLGAARNEGLRHIAGEYVGFADSDDVVPPAAYDVLAGSLEGSGSDFVTGSIVWWEPTGLREPPWMRRLHHPPRTGSTAAEHPEILGDVFAWNKLFRRTFWESAGLSWPEGIRYEDQPTTTRAYLAGQFDVLSEIVYHWRIRDDGSSITQQRASVADLADRLETKRMALASVDASADAGAVRPYFLDRVLAGDLHRYFLLIPGCSDEWWALLESGVRELWGERSLVQSGLPPVHRLTGWLVEQGRREDAATVMTYVAGLSGRPAPRVSSDVGGVRIDVPGIDPATIDPAALAVRESEA
ncbi:MAG TPA: glycosyltransferase family 2 protein [Nocardioides sp.]|nr:glycosyltransferase family 2 protein [Nocardioides sp.]